jgi:DNA topoisomerase-1
MMIAQRLYESGRITYMRTDSVNLSALAIAASKEEIIKTYGEEYSKPRNYHVHAKGAQEAHEAIRPTFAAETGNDWTSQERRLYDLIWKRTIASQMADAKIDKTTVTIDVDGTMEKFIATGEVVAFDGFLKVYHESTDDDDNSTEEACLLPALRVNDRLERREIVSTERFSQGPLRYTEASLVHKLEELGIGRPSTYAPTISTIQQREYVQKGDKKGEERRFEVDTLKGNIITPKTKKEMAGSEKGKLLPTDIGMVVNDFLLNNFPEIMDYNFTAKVEDQFDRIAEGKEEWQAMIKKFDKGFEPTVEKVMKARSEHKAGERELGTDPTSGKPVFVKIGRFGPVVQIGSADDEEKPRFAQMPKDKSIETITLDEALELFKLPRTVGDYEGTTVTIGAGRFGPYVLHAKKYVSLPKGADPMTVTLEEAVALIEEKRKEEQDRHIKVFDEDPKLELLKGRYGPYIAYDGKNYRIEKKLHDRALAGDLDFATCMDIVNSAPEPKTRKAKK